MEMYPKKTHAFIPAQQTTNLRKEHGKCNHKRLSQANKLCHHHHHHRRVVDRLEEAKIDEDNRLGTQRAMSVRHKKNRSQEQMGRVIQVKTIERAALAPQPQTFCGQRAMAKNVR